MSQMVLSIYKDIVEQVLIREDCKKDVSRQILMVKNSRSRLNLIYSFLSFDLDKHQLLEYAALVALNSGETSVMQNLRSFYAYIQGDEILEKIHTEIGLVAKYMGIINKGIRNPGTCTFLERRMIQEISKYVLALAKAYNRIYK